VKAGKGVIDCGATHSIGGVPSLEALADLRGMPDLNHKLRPTYTFGNGKQQQTEARATFNIEAGPHDGEFKIHALDAPTPILVAIESLRALGALIDFKRDLAVWQNVVPDTVCQLERGSTGHLLMDLGGNIASNQVMKVSDYIEVLAKQAEEGASGR
jgi:hypothetical protein